MTVSDPRRELGRRGEELALGHLNARGYTLVARNYRTRFGELDLVVADASCLVFVEVKTRRARGGAGGALEALTPAKQRQVRCMARAWLAQAPDRPRLRDLRFDAIGVTVSAAGELLALDHLEGCF